MQEPASDKITRTTRESAPQPRQDAPVEREVHLVGARIPEEVIRARVDSGFYQTPAVADVVARRIIVRGDLGS
jgi:hypothetical protein